MKPMDAASDGQESLWSPDELMPTVADRALMHFADVFLEGAKHCGDGQLPDEMEAASFAAMLVCAEHRDHITLDHEPRITQCCDAMESRFYGHYDLLPWALASKLLRPTPEVTGLLTRSMAHGHSSIRVYTIQLAWLVRDRLVRRRCMPLLLKNVADTLGGWMASLGLCAALYPTADEFWAAADDFVLDADYANQYERRLAHVRESGLLATQASLLEVEARTRKTISDFALTLHTG